MKQGKKNTEEMLEAIIEQGINEKCSPRVIARTIMDFLFSQIIEQLKGGIE